MKKLFITLIIVLMFTGSTAWAQWIWGEVSYEGGGGVGPDKVVNIYTSETQYQTAVTNQLSLWERRFDSPQYFEKVMCIFCEDHKWYQGTTMIQDTLYVTTRVDITVSEVQNPGKK